MNDALVVALAKTLSQQAAGIALSPGIHHVDDEITLRIKGTVKKGEDVAYTPTVKIPILLAFALFLEKSGFQRHLSKAILIEAMQEALAAGEKAHDHIAARLNDLYSAMESVRDITNALPKQIRSGPTLVAVDVTEDVPVEPFLAG